MLQSLSLSEPTFSLGFIAGISICVVIYVLKQLIPIFISHFLEEQQRTQSSIDEWCGEAITTLGELERQHTLNDILNENGCELRDVFSPLAKTLVRLSNNAPEEIDDNLKMWLYDVAAAHDSFIMVIENDESFETQYNQYGGTTSMIREEMLARTLLAKELIQRFRRGDGDISPSPDILDEMENDPITEFVEE